MSKEKPSWKEIFGWSMFDFANSSYTTIIITVVYSVIFPKIVVGDAPEYRLGNFLWSFALSMSYGIVIITAPMLGAIMDFTARKKNFLFFSYILTIISTFFLYFVEPGDYILAILLIVISNFGFAIGESIVSSFLLDLGKREDVGKISGFAWGIGYFGGLISTAIVIFGLGEITIENYSNLKMVGPITALFFMISGLPTFLLLKEKELPIRISKNSNYFQIGWSRIWQTLADIKKFRDLLLFLFSMFFSHAGLSIVISFAFIYGDQIIRWQSSTMTIMFILTQITASLGSFLFGWMQDKIGSLRTYILTLILWISSIFGIYFTEELTKYLNDNGFFLTEEQTFLIAGIIAGLGLGATQSTSRAIVGLFSPESKIGEFFGFWGVFGKLSAIFGIFGVGISQAYFGLKNAVLFTVSLFFISIIFTFFIQENRGKQNAIEWENSYF